MWRDRAVVERDELVSMIAIAALGLWVRWETGQGMIDIIMDHLPPLL